MVETPDRYVKVGAILLVIENESGSESSVLGEDDPGCQIAYFLGEP